MRINPNGNVVVVGSRGSELGCGECHGHSHGIYIGIYVGFTLCLLNIAMGNGPFIDGLPIKNRGFPWLCEITRWYIGIYIRTFKF